MKKVKISEELQEKLPYIRVCKPCPTATALNGGKTRSLMMWKRKRCPLCGSLTKKYKITTKEEVKQVKKDEAKLTEMQKKIMKKIENRTRDFDCPGTVSAVVKGPIVTEYQFSPDRFTRIRRLKTLDEDLALGLSVDTVSIRRIPGEPVLGIQIPNEERSPVTFESCLPNIMKVKDEMELPLNFGITSDGSPYVEDLARYPHLLIGGATGSGKSVLLQQLLSSLLTVRSPEQLKLILIDPKMVELFPYRGIPHLEMEPVNRVMHVIAVLEDIIKMMRSRTEMLHDMKVNSIKELNDQYKARAAAFKKEGKDQWAQEQMSKCWPYVLVVIDELAEIVLAEKREFIKRMASISQMARASGICVIAATQRPSVDVLPGKVKINFLARASLRVPSPQDSKTILNFKGAETLLNRGDMFVLSPDKTGLQRVHVAYCRKEDRDPIIQRAIQMGYKEGLLMPFPQEGKVVKA